LTISRCRLSRAFLTSVRHAHGGMGGLAVNIVMEGINAALEKRDWNVGESEK